MTDRDELLDEIQTIVAQVVGASRAPTGADAHTPLAEGGLWLDSVELLRVIVACEARFEITFSPAQDLVGGGLKTLGTFADLIRGKIRAR